GSRHGSSVGLGGRGGTIPLPCSATAAREGCPASRVTSNTWRMRRSGPQRKSSFQTHPVGSVFSTAKRHPKKPIASRKPIATTTTRKRILRVAPGADPGVQRALHFGQVGATPSAKSNPRQHLAQIGTRVSLPSSRMCEKADRRERRFFLTLSGRSCRRYQR